MENALFPRPHDTGHIWGEGAISRGYGREAEGFVPLT